MGILDFFKAKREPEDEATLDPVEFAEYVIAHWGGSVGGSRPESKPCENECLRLRRKCKEEKGESFSERIYLFAVAADGLECIDETRAIGVRASCYANAGALYRKDAISVFLKYLSRSDRKKPDWPTWLSLGKAYEGDKQYSNAEKCYKAAVSLDEGQSSCMVLAEFYKKTKKYDEAIELLSKIDNKNVNSNAYINKQIMAHKNLKIGIREHMFCGYDRMETFYDRGTNTNKNYELGLYKKLKEKYKPTFEKHRSLLEQMDFYKAKIKETGYGDESINQGFINTCLADISLYDSLKTFFVEINKLGVVNKYEISDNYKKGYGIFKSLSVFYEKLNMLDESIAICELAIGKGLNDDGTKGGLLGRIERLKKKQVKTNLNA